MYPEYTPSTGDPGPPPPPVAHPAGPVPPSAPKCSRLCLALRSLSCGKAPFQRPASACGVKPSPAATATLISCPRNNQPGAWHLVFVKSLQLLLPETYHTSQHLISGWAEGLGFPARWRLLGGQTTLFMDGARLVGTEEERLCSVVFGHHKGLISWNSFTPISGSSGNVSAQAKASS